MHLSRDDLKAIERAAFRGWPALETADIDGWLWRCSSGGSTRANTVSALDFNGTDVEAAIDRVVALYRTRSATPRFNMTEVNEPADLAERLDRRGWVKKGDNVAMAKDIAPGSVGAVRRPGVTVERADNPSPDWWSIYLAELSANRRDVAPRLVAAVPNPRVFMSAHLDGTVISSGLTALDGGLASIQCMATRPDVRRSGGATAVLASIEAVAAENGVHRLYLQADGDNAAAIGLYERFGFAIVSRYHTRDLV